jgi:hypothetical protein
MPVDGSIVAFPLLLVQTPPGVASDNVTVCPIHTLVGPVITAGSAFTVKVAVLIQVVGNE